MNSMDIPPATVCSYALHDHVGRLRERVLAGNNKACFIEREKILRELVPGAQRQPVSGRYAWVLQELLGRASTPVDLDDVFLGRMVEEQWEGCANGGDVSRSLLPTRGHLTLDWPTLLSKGLSGVVREAQATAVRVGTPEVRDFAANADVCARAIAEFAHRYAQAARDAAHSAPEFAQANFLRAAAALDRVPEGPAYDFFSALQSIWVVHLVTSCYIGARDFAFGYMDRYLLPYYEQGLADGSLTPESARALLGHFLIKPNEITGTRPHNYLAKPTPSQSAKQYLLLGGRDVTGVEQTNDVTELVLDAAALVQMPQPVLTICTDPECSERLRNVAVRATAALGSQIHFYNDRMIRRYLEAQGLPAEVVCEYTMGGCCRFELGGISAFIEKYHSIPAWLLAALNGGVDPVSGQTVAPGIVPPEALRSFEDVLVQFRRVVEHCLSTFVTNRTPSLEHSGEPFHFESLLLKDCVERGRDCDSGGTRYVLRDHNFAGIATVANSLMTIKRLVYDEKRLSLPELLDITAHNFEGHEALREEILNRIPKFGNDQNEVDDIARRAGTIVLDALAAIPAPSNHLLVPGFYSLQHHHTFATNVPATPDGRLRGEPFSENQSPSYGTDTCGITALLSSVARLPLDRTAVGGLNVTFAGKMPLEKIRDVIDSYFALRGLHVGFSFVDRQTLLDAREHPERYRTLTVRMYGFSEYFVALAPFEQNDLIERTRY